ncbi:cullin-1-like isoform X2 [Fagus crenata]|uniref:Cullin N-terminal domain-containing protein n=2 Tax=Fagus sylvatica TaxID=28930 RepID=A0A2N9FDR4_FAGSY
MRRIVMLDEGLRILEEGIVKAKHILIGHPPKTLFSGEDYMKFYNCVYTMCSQRQPYDYSGQLYERYKTALEESIVSVVLPSLNDKREAYLLIELLQMWANYKAMTKCLSGFFLYLDHHFVGRRNIPSLNDLAILCFRNLVFSKLYGSFREAAFSLINQERNGKQVQQDLLKNVLNFFMEIGDGKIDCYEMFEQSMLEDAASYYSQLASELLCCMSYTDYIQKVVWLLIQEKERAGQYLKQASLEKLLEIVKWKLMGETAQVLIEKQKAESRDTTTYQDLLSKYADMSLGEGSSMSLSKQWPKQQ